VRVQCGGHVLVTVLGERAQTGDHASATAPTSFMVQQGGHKKWGTSQQWICGTLHCSRPRLVRDHLHIHHLPRHSLSSGTRGHRSIVHRSSSRCHSLTHSLSLFTLVQPSVFSDHFDPLPLLFTASRIKCIKNTRITFPNKIPLLRRPTQPAQ